MSDDSVTRISVSPKAKKVVFTNNKHRKYNQKELEIMKKEKKPYPKDYWHFLQDVNMYNENGKKDKIIQTDIEINNIFCTDEGEITAIGRMQPVLKYRGKQILMFYDKKSKLAKIINEEEAKERKIRVEGIGKIYQENKLVWVNSLETPLKGSTITLFDIKGNIVWQYYNTYLSVFYWNNIYFLPNSNHIYVEGHYPDLSAREKSVRKTWVLDQNGNCVKLLDGWDNQK